MSAVMPPPVRRARGWLRWVGGALVTLLALGAFAAFVFFQQFYPAPPAANFAAPKDAAEAQRQDLSYFRHYLELDRSYSPAARTEAARLLDGYLAQAGAMDPAQFALAISRMVALADNGQSTLVKGPLSRTFNRLPCRFYHFADGYYVIRARPACEALLGGKVVSIGGTPVEELADRMFEYTRGPRNHYDQFGSLFFLESPALLNAAGWVPQASEVALSVRMPDGQLRDALLAADPPDTNAPDTYSDDYLSPLHIEGEAPDWKALLPIDSTLPVFLRDYDTPFRSDWWPESRTFYLQFRTNEDDVGQSIRAFAAQARKEIVAREPKTIVLDLRLDQDGDFITTAKLVSRIASLSPATTHVYVLTSAWTFAGGAGSAALARTHADGRMTVVGTPVGDRLRVWAEGGDMRLPNSGLQLVYATGLHDYTRSCLGQSGCYWPLYIYPVRVKTREPDVNVPYTFDDYVNLRDPLVEYIMHVATP